MFGLSGEHLLILAGVLLIFGPRKLPELGASLGKALRNFKEGLNTPQSSGSVETQKPEISLNRPSVHSLPAQENSINSSMNAHSEDKTKPVETS